MTEILKKTPQTHRLQARGTGELTEKSADSSDISEEVQCYILMQEHGALSEMCGIGIIFCNTGSFFRCLINVVIQLRGKGFSKNHSKTAGIWSRGTVDLA